MNRLETFLRAQLEGSRFEQHAIPLDLLRDLAAIEDLVIEVAKWRYLQEHSERGRVPKGFTDTVFLALSAIEPGSAIAGIDLVVNSDELFDQTELYFERARGSILGAINAAAHSENILEYLPDNLLGYFNRVGRGLRDKETLVLGDRDGTIQSRLTQPVRKKLVFASERARQYSEDVVLRGLVPEVDQERRTFQLQLAGGRRVGVDIEPAHEDIVLKSFNNYRENMKISMQGVGFYDKAGHLQRIESVDHIVELDPLDVAARIDELRLLTYGWLDGLGKAPEQSGLDWVQELFDMNYPDHIPLPFLYPTPEGGIQAEWSIHTTEISLEIHLNEKTGVWHEYNSNGEYEDEKLLKLEDQKEFIWVVNRIEQLQRET